MDAQRRDLVIASKHYHETAGETPVCAQCGIDIAELNHRSDYCQACEDAIYAAEHEITPADWVFMALWPNS